MNIGFDARFYSPSATGIGRHIAEVLNVLGKLDDKNKYTVLLNEKNFDNFKVVPEAGDPYDYDDWIWDGAIGGYIRRPAAST